MGRTKDENFMLRLFDEASKRESFDEPIDKYMVGQAIGLHPRAVDTICNLLVRANFIKKRGETDIVITPHGLKLIEELRPKI